MSDYRETAAYLAGQSPRERWEQHQANMTAKQQRYEDARSFQTALNRLLGDVDDYAPVGHALDEEVPQDAEWVDEWVDFMTDTAREKAEEARHGFVSYESVPHELVPRAFERHGWGNGVVEVNGYFAPAITASVNPHVARALTAPGRLRERAEELRRRAITQAEAMEALAEEIEGAVKRAAGEQSSEQSE